jgi:hypothetical protein
VAGAAVKAAVTAQSLQFGAVVGAIFFAVHPMHTEAVSNITNRSELLSFVAQLSGFLVFAQITKRATWLWQG